MPGRPATISAEPADVGPNLDLRVTLVDSTGATVAADGTPTTCVPSCGMGATVAIPVFGGPWFVVVDGVGSGSQGADQAFGSGYPDYGSLGAYTLDAVGCGVAAQPPSAPRDTVATTVPTTPTSTVGVTTVTWRAPASTGSAGTALIDYEVSLDDGPWTNPLGNGTSTSWTTDQARHTVAVRALNTAGAGPAVVLRSVSPEALPPGLDGRPREFGLDAYVHWQADPETGGSAPIRMDVSTSATGSPLFFADGGTLNGTVDFPLTLGRTYWLSVSNVAGQGPRTSFVARTTPVLSGPVRTPSVLTDRVERTATFNWTRPVDDGGGPTFGYQVALDDGPWVEVSKPSHTFADVAGGEHVADVRPVNAAGPGPETPVTFEMPVDTPPAAVNDSYTTLEDTALIIATPGVLGNDTDADSDPLTASLVASPTHGTVSLAANGSFTYTPTIGYNGSDSFTYRANDGGQNSNLATVSLTVTPVSDAPSAGDDSYTDGRGHRADRPCSGRAGQRRRSRRRHAQRQSPCAGPGPRHGDLNAGRLVHLHPGGRLPRPRLVHLRRTTATATSTGHRLAHRHPGQRRPQRGRRRYATAEDTTLTVPAPGVLGNDGDPDGDALTAGAGSGPGPRHPTLNPTAPSPTPRRPELPRRRLLHLQRQRRRGRRAWPPCPSPSPPSTTPPAAAADAYTTAEDTALTVAAPGVLGNDSDPTATHSPRCWRHGPAHGTVMLNPNGSFTYTPAPTTTARTRSPTAPTTARLTRNVATVSLAVTPVNDAPTVTVTPGSMHQRQDRPGSDGADAGRRRLRGRGTGGAAASSNTALVSTKSLVITGTGQSRALGITAVDKKKGSAIITVTINDGSRSTTASLQVLVGTTNAETISGTTGVDALGGRSWRQHPAGPRRSGPTVRRKRQ